MRTKKKPRRGDRIQAGVKPLTNMRTKKKPQRGDGMATYPLSFRHSSGVLMGGRFHTGVTLPLTPACILSPLRGSFFAHVLQGLYTPACALSPLRGFPLQALSGFSTKSEWYASSRRVPLQSVNQIIKFDKRVMVSLFCSEINDFCTARHSFSRKSMIFAPHGTLLLGNQ